MISGPGRNGHTLACLFQAPLLRPSSSNPGGIDQARPGTRNVAVSSSETGPGDRGPGGDFGDPEPVLQRACSSQHSKPPEHALPVLAGACTSEGTGHRHDQAVWNAVNPGGPYPASVCTGRGRPYAVGGAAARYPQESGLSHMASRNAPLPWRHAHLSFPRLCAFALPRRGGRALARLPSTPRSGRFWQPLEGTRPNP